MTPAPLIAAVAVALVAAMTIAWGVQRATRNAGWIDVIWSFATGFAGAGFALGTGVVDLRHGLMAAFAIAWGARLGLHILGRTVKGQDDPRYAKLIEGWGPKAPLRLFLFVMVQAGAALLLASAVLLGALLPSDGLRVLDVVAVAVLVIAIGGEAIADRQLRAFSHDPANKGRVCDIGLWGTSRHPNYFFEWLGWCAWALFAIDPTGGHAIGWLAFAAPAFMYWLLVHVSGVPPLEAHMLDSRGDAFRDYQRRVKVFFPGPQHAAPTRSPA